MTDPLSVQWPSIGGAIDRLYVALDSGDYGEYDAYVKRYAERLNVTDLGNLKAIIEDEASETTDTQITMKRIGKLMGT